ncbi:DMT family transporter [Conexibacter sp. JD483]|uniref:DMT family transporter n=1 Tax=unclassified Conexibacter TaxID=2627773 RepID=UPI00271FF109|nr:MULTISPECIES: DMT family transporter [unclassified Conexibacter]MDO8184002.1 DMT family transporter [Conexibacter sp. CPCC 205706]MDO8196994.1 DMT family transporter [Conexibacter sp. CPCC 205762]MDR9367910.1 DMT family transporter [Conexibacter sp. JD483]
MNVSPQISRERQGLLLCIVAALGFGSMAVLAKLAYAAGASVLTLMSVRFAVGAGLLWIIAAHRGVARADKRSALAALALGLFLYSAESGLYASALTRIDASLGELLMFSYPAIVVVAAIALRREPPSRRRLGAVAIATAGVVLTLAGGATGAIDPVGVGLALAAAAIYATYVLSADALGGRMHPLTFAALICSGAAIAFAAAGTTTGTIHLGALHWQAWLWIVVIAIGSTTIGMSAFVAGVERLGPSRASIMSALDPLVAMTLAGIVFGEQLSPIQLVGAMLVIGAVVILQVPVRRRLARRRAALPIASRDRGASACPAPQPSAGSLALVTSERS